MVRAMRILGLIWSSCATLFCGAVALAQPAAPAGTASAVQVPAAPSLAEVTPPPPSPSATPQARPALSAAASGAALAAAKQPAKQPETFWIGTSVVFRNIINLTTGKYPPVGLSYSLNLSGRIVDSVMWTFDLSAATPITAFNPNPSLSLGSAFVVAPRFVINPALLYSASFYYKTDPQPPVGSRDTQHSVGLSVAFGFIRPPVIVAPVLIVSHNVTLKQWVVAFALKLGTSLFAL